MLSTATGSIWAPGGRFFLCFGGPPGGANIVDSEGQLVASVPDIGEDATWLPGSEQLQAWIDATRIGIYGVDGALDRSLSLPDGYTRMTGSGAAWVGDGRSVVVQIHRGAGALETWRLPVDASAPSPIAEDDPLANPDFSFTADGGQMAFTRVELEHDRRLYVANADGTGVRVLRGRPHPVQADLVSGRRAHCLPARMACGAMVRLRHRGRGRALRIVPGADSAPRPRRLAEFQLVGGRQQDNAAGAR